MSKLDKEINVSEEMKRCIKYYEHIDKFGKKLADIIDKKIQPLLDEGNYDEAKKQLRAFYMPSIGEFGSIFIEYDLILANINRLQYANKNE